MALIFHKSADDEEAFIFHPRRKGFFVDFEGFAGS